MNHRFCQGVIAITGHDHINLQVAVSCKLLNKSIPVYCRSEIDDEAKNMASFGTNLIVDPYQIFADKLALLISNPQLHRIQSWLTNQHKLSHTANNKPIPKGKWIICGFGRLGKAIVQRLQNLDIDIIVIDEDPKQAMAPSNSITGRGTEAKTLQEAGIEDAAVIVAANKDDANNLSILITAQQLNPNIFSIARVNQEANNRLFTEANWDYIMRRSQLIANYMLTQISRPLVSGFIQYSASLSHSNTEQLIDNISQITQNQPPITWRLTIDKDNAPALYAHLAQDHKVTLGQTYKTDKSHKLASKPCIPLLLKRQTICHLLPKDDIELMAGDQLLFCSQRQGHILPQHLKDNTELLDTLINHNTHYIPLLRWLHRRSTQ